MTDTSPSAPAGLGPTVHLLDVSKSYHEGSRTLDVLVDSTAAIDSGERVAIVGPSGSGKSTLLNLVSGIDAPDAGRIVVGETEIGRLSEHERTLFRRHHVGFVFQFFNLVPTLTAVENVQLPLELSNGVSASEANERAMELLAAVELADRADTFPDLLSGGEQQRIAIARALVHGPGLVLADEPTGNLDVDTSARVTDLLESLVEEAGATLLVVTHAPSLAERLDRTLRLERGRLVES